MTTPGSKIKELRKALGLSQQDIARHLRISRVTVSQWENGETAPRGNRLEDLAQILQTTTAVLEAYGIMNAKQIALKLASSSHVPLVEWPDLAKFLDGDTEIRNGCRRISIDEAAPDRFAIAMNDHSMASGDPLHGIAKGDRLIIATKRQPNNDEFVLGAVATENGVEYVIRNFRRRAGGVFDLVPLSPDFETLSSKGRQSITVVGVAVEHCRKLANAKNETAIFDEIAREGRVGIVSKGRTGDDIRTKEAMLETARRVAFVGRRTLLEEGNFADDASSGAYIVSADRLMQAYNRHTKKAPNTDDDEKQ